MPLFFVRNKGIFLIMAKSRCYLKAFFLLFKIALASSFEWPQRKVSLPAEAAAERFYTQS